MSRQVKQVAVLGSTGSVGTSTLEVLLGSQGRLQAYALSAHARLDLLVEQACQVRPRWVVATDADQAALFDWSGLPDGTDLLVGDEGISHVVTQGEVDVVVTAIVGSAGLRGTWATIEAGKTVALANKETLVMAGSLVTELAARSRSTIIPVDSEHSAIFQALQAGRRDQVARIVLTASGGPFRHLTPDELQQVTVEETLSHPTWNMGPKITVDSATMMNKALEIVEARWLFDIPAEKIDVVIHPQSIVHSLVEFVDGSVIAQMSPPDMKLPIQYALDYPDRHPGVAARLDLSQSLHLEFEPLDIERFPAITLGLEAARTGGTTGAVLSAANEAAVDRFLAGELRFTEIVPLVRSVVASHSFEHHPTLERLESLDAWARKEVSRCLCT